MFRKMELWRHKHCIDIDFYVVKKTYENEKYVKLKVLYWNRHSKLFHFLEPEEVKIKREDFLKWSLLERTI